MHYAQQVPVDTAATEEDAGAQQPVTALAAKVFKDTVKSSQVQIEVQMLILAQGHPNIARLHSVFHWRRGAGLAGSWCLMMEFCAWGNVNEYIEDEGKLGEGQARSVMRPIFGALEHLHSKGMVHRDVKPENVLLRAGGEPVLGDYGIACLPDRHAAEARRRVGTAGYAAPEVLQELGCCSKSDVFGAGAMLFFILAAAPPFPAETPYAVCLRIISDELDVGPDSPLGDASAACQDLLLRLMQKKPECRPTALEASEADWFVNGGAKCLHAPAWTLEDPEVPEEAAPLPLCTPAPP